MAQITLDNVTKSWGETRVLKPLNLQIENGEFVAILGAFRLRQVDDAVPAGGSFTRQAGGAISFDGHNVNGIDARDRNVGIVFQSYALYPPT